MKFNADKTLTIVLRLIIALTSSITLFFVLMVPPIVAAKYTLMGYLAYGIVYVWLAFYISAIGSWLINKPIINNLYLNVFGFATIATLTLGVLVTLGFGLFFTGPTILFNIYLIFWLIRARDFKLNRPRNSFFASDEKFGDDI